MGKVQDPHVELVKKALDELASILVQHYPAAKELSSELLETVFVPKAIIKQLVLLFALEAGMVTVNQVTAVVSAILGNFSTRTRLIRQLISEQTRAPTQDEWMELAERIDSLQGSDVWRSESKSDLYDRDRISARIDEYVHLMRRHDIFELMFVLRGSIGRNKFGLLHEGLFNKALAGSKILIETYHQVVCRALDMVCDSDVLPGEDPIPTDARLAFFNETRHSYGRTALMLSGGAALGFYHVGVVRTLMANNLMPRVLGGASAGSIVCAMIGTRTDEEMQDLFDARGTNAPGHSGKIKINFFRPHTDSRAQENVQSRTKKGGFWEVYYNTAGAFRDLKRTVQGFVPWPLRHFTSFVYNVITFNTRPQDLFKHDTNHFRECVKANVGDFTFQEAFDRTGRILNIVVTPLHKGDPPRLLNYLTAPHVLVWSAAVASSSLPGVFEANRLVVKEADGWERYESGARVAFSDGSMEADLPMQQLSEMFNVNHFIISQANPHAVLFASYRQKSTVFTGILTAAIQNVVTFLKDQLRSWLANLVDCVGLSRSMFGSDRGLPTQFLTQEYEGRSSDISLIPWLHHRSLLSALLHIIYNPSEAEFREWIAGAERETWRFLPAIKSHIAEEITLDRCVQRLRKRLTLESWQKQSRLSESTGQKLGEKIPSFFASPSLANLGGLGITDQPELEGLRDCERTRQRKENASENKDLRSHEVSDLAIHPGWGGMGLRGNRSSGNLVRNHSDASGLFIEDDDGQNQQQQPGENHRETPKRDSSNSGISTETSLDEHKGYIKTTSMARFYYRKISHGHGSTGDLALRRTPDASVQTSGHEEGGEANTNILARRKSKSYGDFKGDLGELKFEPLKD